ncbi:hypothetical protein ACWD2L_05745 [Streptomyces sp. NPDC002754]
MTTKPTDKVLLNAVGDIVRDDSRGQIAKVTGVDPEQKLLTLARPSGYSWKADDHHCRPASEQDLKAWQATTRMVEKCHR